MKIINFVVIVADLLVFISLSFRFYTNIFIQKKLRGKKFFLRQNNKKLHKTKAVLSLLLALLSISSFT